MKTIDILAASVFLVCETFAIVTDIKYRHRQPSKRLNVLLWIAEILAVTSLVYLATLRAIPYVWYCMRDMP